MVFRVRQVTPDNIPHHLDTDNMEDMELDYYPDESKIVSDPIPMTYNTSNTSATPTPTSGDERDQMPLDLWILVIRPSLLLSLLVKISIRGEFDIVLQTFINEVITSKFQVS